VITTVDSRICVRDPDRFVFTIAEDGDQVGIGKHWTHLADALSNVRLVSDRDLLDITALPDIGHPVGEIRPFNSIIERPRDRHRPRDRTHAQVFERLDVVRVVRLRENRLDVEFCLCELCDEQVHVVVTSRVDFAIASHSFQRARQRERGKVVHREQLIKSETIDSMITRALFI